jgi:predicted glycoside hydrolase/deacetylase ChbG (UPF0249 family)
MTTQKRNRRTRVEMLAALEAKLEKLKAQVSGTYDPTSDEGTFIEKRLRRAIRRRNTALGNAQTLMDGRQATERSPSVSPIDVKIENAEKRLTDLRAAKARAVEMQAQLPFDIERLEALLEKAEAGEDVEFPNDLYRLPNEGERTDAEIEAGSVVDNNDD